jgi:hypothetical protein
MPPGLVQLSGSLSQSTACSIGFIRPSSP